MYNLDEEKIFIVKIVFFLARIFFCSNSINAEPLLNPYIQPQLTMCNDVTLRRYIKKRIAGNRVGRGLYRNIIFF